MTTLLEVTSLNKHFGGVAAVSDVSFTIAEGEILGLIGPNGAGKTTLFNLVNGVIRPDSGSARFDGEELIGRPPYDIVRQGLARTHQIVKPLNEMSVLDNVTVGACFGKDGLGLVAARRQAMEVIEQVGLAPQTQVFAGSLTIAGKKRLEVARALASRPRLLLLDEVLAGLNPTEVSRMISIIRDIREQSGVAILMIEHLMQAIMSLSDRIVVLNFGRKLAEGLPDEVARDESVIEAYLGDPDMADKLMEDA